MKKWLCGILLLGITLFSNTSYAENWDDVMILDECQVYLDTDSIYCDYDSNSINFRLKSVVSDKGKDIVLADKNYNSEDEKIFRSIAYQIEDKSYFVAEKILYTKQNTFYDINNNVMYVQNKNKGVDLGKDGEYGFEKMVILKVFEYLR